MREKRNVNRLIALIMAVIMLLSLVAYDNRFTTNAEDDEKPDTETVTISVEEIIKKAGENPDLFKLTAFFKGDSIKVDGGVYFLLDATELVSDGDITGVPEMATGTDAEILKSSITINDIDGSIKIALYALNEEDDESYILAGILTLYQDTEAPIIGDITVTTEDDKILEKEEDGKTYYLVPWKTKVNFSVLISDEGDPVSGIDKVELVDENGEVIGSLDATGEVSDGKAIYSGTITDEGKYTIYAYDQAGHRSEQDIEVRYSNVIKSVHVAYCNKDSEDNEVHYLLIPKDKLAQEAMVSVTVEIEVTDGEPIDRTLYYYAGAKGGVSDQFQSVSFDNDTNTAEFDIPVSMASTEENGLNWLTMYITDVYGTSNYFNQEGHIIFIQNEPPTLEAEISLTNVKEEDIYTDVTDVYSDTEYTDLAEKPWSKEIEVKLKAEGWSSFIKTVTYSIDEGKYTGTLKDDTGITDDLREFNWNNEDNPFVLSKIVKDGEHTVSFTVSDYFGEDNETTYATTFCLDTTAPKVTADSKFGGCSVDDIETTETRSGGRKYYYLTTKDAPETITVHATDAKSGSGIKQLRVTINGVEEIIEPDSDADIYNFAWSFSEKKVGYYDVEIVALDYAGNTSDVLKFGFMIGEGLKTSLSAKVTNTETGATLDLGESGDSSYTRFGKSVVTYTVSGLGLKKEDITYGPSNMGIVWSVETTSDPDNPGYTTITVTGKLPDKEGIYDISCSVRKTGSKSSVITDSMRIVCDKTSPLEFVLTPIGSYTTLKETPGIYYFQDTPKVRVKIMDNYSLESFTLTDDQTPAHKWVIVNSNNALADDNGVEKSRQFELTNAAKNTLFQLSYQAKDKAGNYITSKIKNRFVYDVTEPTITVSQVDYWNGGKVSLNVDVEDKFYVSRLETEVTRNGEKIEGLSGDYADYASFTVATSTKNTLSYTVEGVYRVTVKAYDAAGNESRTVTRTFVIDKTAPEVTWSGIPTDPNRSSRNITVGFSITDKYGIDPENTRSGNKSKVVITRYYTTYDGITGKNTVTVEDISSTELSASSICGQLDQKACSYYFEIEAIDNAGNSSGVIRTPRFYIDKTAPTFTISPIPAQINSGYYKGTVSFKVNVTEQFGFTHAISIVDKNAAINGENCVTPSNITFNGKTGSFDVSVDTANASSGTFALTVTVTDIFGNQSSKDINFIIDKQKPVITLGSVPAVNSGNVTIPITISDDYRHGSYNVDVVRLDASGREVYHNSTYRTGNWNDSSNINWTETFTEEGDYTVTVTAMDKAGNHADTKTASFRIDKNVPILSISGVNDTQTSVCTATMSIDESFDMGYADSVQNTSANVDITRRTDSSPESLIANLTYSDFSGSNPHTATYSFSEDGIYTITFDATDATGNRAATATKTFKVDTTAPVLNVSVADRNANPVESYEAIGSQNTEDPNYVVMNVSVEELFYTTNNVTFTVLKDGTDVSNQFFTAYSNRGEVSAVTQTFEEDGVYTVKISAVDELGNAAETYSIVFKVDNTAPTLEKTSVLDAFLAKADTDGNILLNGDDFAAISEMGYEALWNVNDTSVFTVDVKMDGVDFIDFSDLSDGYHKLTITVTDEVGHQSVQEFAFTYDGTAPRIIITGIENGETTTEPFVLTISLEDQEDTITRIVINGEAVDPSLYQETNRYEYAVETYGEYEIIVNATDLAGNTSSTYNSETGEIFSFQLKEQTSFFIWLIFIIVGILLLLGIILLIVRMKKKKK